MSELVRLTNGVSTVNVDPETADRLKAQGWKASTSKRASEPKPADKKK